MRKLLLALQYWEGDREQAMKLARFIADLQPSHSLAADFMFVRRFDCKESDSATVEHVSRKFNTHTFQCRRRGVGWPTGCNDLWAGLMENLYHRMESKMLPHYRAILTFEADCCPLTNDWIERLGKRWDSLRGVCMAGDIVEAEHMHEHINGNCLVSTNLEFLRWISKIAVCPPRCGWDYYFAPEFKKRGWADIPEIISVWRTSGYTAKRYTQLVKDGVVFLHGVKDDSLLDMTRKYLL